MAKDNREKKGMRLIHYVPDYVVFDLETTGVSVYNDDIIEISAVKVKGGEIIDTFSTLVNPDRPIPYAATRVNGITDDLVADAPYLKDVLADFLEFIGDNVLVGHNIYSFDLNFIYDAALNLYGRYVENDYIDTLFMARKCLPKLSHHKLVDIAEHFNINTQGAHRALNDCIMNQKCYEEMGKLQEEIPTVICPKCGGEMVKRAGKFGEFYGCSNYPNCRGTMNIKDVH
ncbi:MAG TPA: DNA polymerase III subunit epsilon [Lachnospiraceae bacterium]|nr:exonuclease domain-containing protein [uncultured Lachnoclostridium sp.]HAU84569.1 DNA polymerase III subunit epsilon [Lachnospiraceae bacterium]